jgi:dolichyl-phosphate-mannose--protein O-mannosyl transferase
VPTRSTDDGWSVLDTILIVVLTAAAGALRFAGITHPRGFVFDEHYAADGCFYMFGPQRFCMTTTEISVVHPPLGKWLIGAGIRLFGFSPAGWRVAPLVAGTLSVALLYLLARRLLGSRLAASLAAGFLALDFLHFVMSRTAMLDIFVVFFGLASFLSFTYDADRDSACEVDSPGIFRQLFVRRWLVGAGLAGGAALACKWSGGYLLAAVLLLASLRELERTKGRAQRYRHVAREAMLLVITLVMLPALIYAASYAGRLEGTLFAWPWAQQSWVHSFVARQELMLEHHTGSLYIHPYMSPAWSWPFIKRPVLFLFRDAGDGDYQEILAFGNPVAWWIGLFALAASVWRLVRSRSLRSPEATIVAGFAAGYLPWFVLTRQEAFLYYLLPALPFLYLALAQGLAAMSSQSLRAATIGGLTVATVGMFVFFRPVLVGTPLPHAQWERRMFFSNCGPAPESEKRPIDKPIPPPAGWCWV